jgi:hypothetical protein
MQLFRELRVERGETELEGRRNKERRAPRGFMLCVLSSPGTLFI